MTNAVRKTLQVWEALNTTISHGDFSVLCLRCLGFHRLDLLAVARGNRSDFHNTPMKKEVDEILLKYELLPAEVWIRFIRKAGKGGGCVGWGGRDFLGIVGDIYSEDPPE